MYNIFTIILFSSFILFGQSVDQIKEQIKSSGITPEQAKQMAKDRGYSDGQIEAEARSRGIIIDSNVDNIEVDNSSELSDYNSNEFIDDPIINILELDSIGKDLKALNYFG